MCDYQENLEISVSLQANLKQKEQHSSHTVSETEVYGRPIRKRKRTVKAEKLDNFSIPCLRKGRQDLPLREKIKILEMLENDPKTPQRVIASTFRVSQSQISRIQNNKERLKKAWQNGNVNRKRNRKGKGGLIEIKLLEWYNEIKRDGLPISGPTLMEKAKGLAQDLNLDFTPTSGWFGRWKSRNGVTLKLAKSDDASLMFNKISIHWRRYTFNKVLKECNLENIWFLDSMVLLSKAVPEDLECGETDVSEKGRMLIFFAFNYFGTERKSPLIFGAEQPPNDNTALDYYCQHGDALKSWFTKWLVNWDQNLRRERRKISLIMCRASYVSETLNLTSINLHYFPECEVNDLRLRPFYFGISLTFKALFRHQMATRHFSYSACKAIPSKRTSPSAGEQSFIWSISTSLDNLLDRIFMIRRAWKHVHRDVFIRGLVKAGLSKHVQSLSIEAEVDPPPGMTSDEFDKFVSIEDRFYASVDLDSCGDVDRELRHTDDQTFPISESEALFSCSVLRMYLQRKHECALADPLAEIESHVQRQVLAIGDRGADVHSSVDPLFDSRSIHSMEKHVTSVIKQEALKTDAYTDQKPTSENHTEHIGVSAETLQDNTNKYLANYPTQEVLLPPPPQTQGGMNDTLKAPHCDQVTTLSHGTQPAQPVGQYQTATSYIPQNLELKSFAIGVPRTIPDISIDRFTIHPDVQHARPVNDINPHIIPATQLTNQAPTFITFASHF